MSARSARATARRQVSSWKPAPPGRRTGQPAHRLSPREVEVLGLLREGFTNTEIGRLLGISPRTAKAHVAAVIEKLDAVDRTQAVARAYDLGLLKAVRPVATGGPR